MTQLQPRNREFFADILKSLKALPREPIQKYMSSKTEDGHHSCDNFFNAVFITLYAEDYYGYIDLPKILSLSRQKDLYSRLSSDILKTLNNQLSILRAEFNTLKLIDLDGTLHVKLELLLETLIADIKQDVLSAIDENTILAVDQSIDGFSFISTSNNVCIEDVEEPIESRTAQRRFSLEKNTDGYSRYNLKAGEGYILKQFFGDAPNEFIMADIPLALTEYNDNKLIFVGLPVKGGCDDSQIIDFRNMKFIVYIDGGITIKCRLYLSANEFCEYEL